jgi:2-oxo-4-hydroxy-4-carboxy--5-ureidoimidazoline (OHCU) decarboxylase
MALTLGDMNLMDFDLFVETFGNIMEHSSLITAALWTRRPFVSLSHALEEIEDIVAQLPSSGTFQHDD